MEGNEYINWGDKQQQQQNGSLQQPPSLSTSTSDPQPIIQRQFWHGESGIDAADGSMPQNSFLSTADNPTYSSYGVQEHQRPDDYAQQMLHIPYPSSKSSAPSMSPPLVDQSNYAIHQQQNPSHGGFPGAIDMSSTNSSQGYPPTFQSVSNQTSATQNTNHQQVPQQQHLQPQQIQQHIEQTSRQIPEAQVRAPLPNPYQYANNALFRSAYHQNPYQGYSPNAYGHPMSLHHAQHVQSPASMTPYNPNGQHMGTMNPQMQYNYQPLSNGYNPYPSNEEIVLHNTPQYYQDRVNSMPQAQYYSHQNIKPVYTPAQVKANKPAKADAPSSPPRPTDAIEALQYDVSHCLNDYNTSRDLKGCAAALLAIMSTCDQVIPLNDERSPSVSGDKSSVSSSTKDKLDPKEKQVALLSVVSSQIKGNMIEEVSKNKSIRAKLRTWFVRAHKDNSFAALKATIAVLDKLTFLNEQLLAEVKFGKALLIVSRKCENQEVKDSLEKWVPKAQKSLEVEEELNKTASKAPPIEEEPKTKKTKVAATPVSSKVGANADPKRTIRGAVTAKKVEPVAKLNAAFFKKEIPAIPTKVAGIAKPGVLSVLNSIKVKKRVDEKELDAVKSTIDTSKPVTSSTHKAPPATVTPAFSALKFVETLKRGASPNITTDSQPEAKKRKQKKKVSWKPDNDLEQIRLFETVESEDGEGDVAHTPHEYGNARDLDRKEGALLHGGVMHDREEDFLDWETPRVIDFSHKDLVQGAPVRGPKKAGSLILNSIESDRQSAKEQDPEVRYASMSEIPWSPTESHTDVASPSTDLNKTKIIPLPAELRVHPKVQQILGKFAHITSEVLAQPEESLRFTPQTPASIPPPPPSGGSDIAAILASIAAAQHAANAKAAGSTTTGSITGPSGYGNADSSSQSSLSTPHTATIAETTHAPTQGAALPPLPLANLDPKLAEFLKSLAAQNAGILPPLPPPPLPSATAAPGGSSLPPPSFPALNQRSGSSNTNSALSVPMPMPMPVPIPTPMTDVRPWVTINTGGKYRETCRFIGLGKCEKGDACPYIHPQN